MSNQGTAKIGIPIRYEIETHSGETFRAIIKVPGGTAGKTFVCNFRHEHLGTPLEPAPPPGMVLEGDSLVNF